MQIPNQWQQPGNWLGCAGVMGLLIVIFAGVFLFARYDAKRFEKEGLVAEATILYKRTETMRSGTSEAQRSTRFLLDVNFEPEVASNIVYATVAIEEAHYTALAPNDVIGIYYLPKNPESVRFAPEVIDWGARRYYLLFVLMGALGLATLVRGLHLKRLQAGND